MTRAHRGHARLLLAAGRVRAAGKAVADEWLRAEWESVDAVKADAEAPVRRLYARLLRDQRDAVLARLGAVTKADPGDLLLGSLLLDVEAWAARIADEFGAALAEALLSGFRTGALRVGAGDLRPRVGGYAADVLRAVVEKIQGATVTTQAEVGAIVRDGIEAGETVEEIAGRLREAFDEWAEWRAEAVARTSTVGPFEAGQLESFRDAGVDARRLLSQRDGRVRPSHWQADGQEVGVDEPFTIGGYLAMFPGDPALPASEVINCRCTVLPIIRADKARRRPEAVVDVTDLNEREMEWVERGLRDAKIRAAHAAGMKGLSDLAERFNVSESTARRAIWGA